VVDNLGGWFADEVLLMRCGWSVRRTRRVMQGFASGLPMLALAALCSVSEPGLATILLTAAIAGGSLAHAGYGANMIDVCGGRPELTGLFVSVSNTLGTLPGIVANWSTGRMLAAGGPGGGWPRVFFTAICVSAVGLGLFMRHAQGHDVFKARRPSRPVALLPVFGKNDPSRSPH